MVAQYFWIFGSLIFALLGFVHLRITFFGKKLYPKDEVVENGMHNTHPRLTKETTIWRAWVGFNASHSAGAIFFGIVNMALATTHFPILMEPVFLTLNLVFVGFFLYLGKTYWFKISFIGILLAFLSFGVSGTMVLFDI